MRYEPRTGLPKVTWRQLLDRNGQPILADFGEEEALEKHQHLLGDTSGITREALLAYTRAVVEDVTDL